MRLKICGFKCHLESEYIFINGEMTLIKGPSGQGKSSILQAIFWALYKNMRSIYNNARVTKNLSVYLELPGITIFRTKNPEFLKVTLNNSIYEGDVAQSIIDNHFGNREVWKACSYIEQQSRCGLLIGSASERLELLNSLSFTGDNPKEYISKISEKLKEQTNLFMVNQSSFVTELDLYNKEITENPVKYILDEKEIEDIRKDIIELEKKEKIYYEQVCNFERLKGTWNYLCTSLENLKEKYIKDHSFPQYEQLEKEIVIPSYLYETKTVPFLEEKSYITYEEYSKTKTSLSNEIVNFTSLISERKKLNEELEKIEKELIIAETKIVNIPNISNLVNKEIKEEDIWRSKNLEDDFINNLNKCKVLKIEYSRDIIKQILDEWTEELSICNNLEKHISNYTKLLTIEEKIKKENDVGDIEELEKLSREKSLLISELKKGLELLTCPNCKTPLRYRNSVLSIGERNPVSLGEITLAQKEHEKLEKLLKKARDIKNLKDNVRFLEDNLNGMRKDIENYLKNGSKIQELSNKISNLSSIKVVNCPELSSQVLSDILKFQKLYRNKDKIIERLNSMNIPNDINEKKEKLNNIEEIYRQEQERVQNNQKLMKAYQDDESKRLKELSKWENDKHTQKERNKKIEERNRKIDRDKERIENERKTIKFQIENNENEIQNIKKQMNESAQKEYENIRKDLENKKKFLDDAIYGDKIVKRGNELREKREKLVSLQEDVEALNKLKLKAIEVECKQLEDTVNNINIVLETTLPIFFNDPISLKLLLYKNIKSTKQIKPCLNLEIYYKGCKYENVNSLSGGEGDRISLALLLALNSVSNSPILLLDECVASLDGELKESCITAIKSIPNKTVICVDHDDSLEGFYDSIISL